jgi:hypothetical protein
VTGRNRREVVFAAAVAANLAILFWPHAVGPGGLPGLDKVVHAASFGLVAWSGLRAGAPARWLLPVLALHAVGSEVIQHLYVPGRSGDPWDVVADLAGVALGAAGARWRHGTRAGAHDGAAARRDAGPG